VDSLLKDSESGLIFFKAENLSDYLTDLKSLIAGGGCRIQRFER
jgi:hypothetical protein